MCVLWSEPWPSIIAALKKGTFGLFLGVLLYTIVILRLICILGLKTASRFLLSFPNQQISGKWHLRVRRVAMKIFKLKYQERSGLRGKGHSSNLGNYLDEIMDPELSLIILSAPRSWPESPPCASLNKINDSRPLTSIFKHTVMRP